MSIADTAALTVPVPSGKPLMSASPPAFPYWFTGYRRLFLNCPDIDAPAGRIVTNGGRRRSPTWEPAPGCSCVYGADPDGNIVELDNRSLERFHANRE